jgi:cellulose synthase/poly-beta-1,6-N-acetylglucosamine synthase-like glycosyltransferase
MEKFSILIPSYKEYERIQNLIKIILKDKFKKFIKEVIVVTPDEIKLPKSKKIILIKEKKRRGKCYAIRTGLKKVNSQIVVLLSSDLKMRKNFLQYLITHFNDPKVGMVIGKPKADRNSKIYSFAKIIWDLHHLICLKEPKGTEICAFRKIFNNFPRVSADEVFIEYKIRKSGYEIVYEPKAFGYTKIPHSIHYFFTQRTRSFFGHLEILKKYKFRTSTIKVKNLLESVIVYLQLNKKLKTFLTLFLIIQFEILARIIGLIHFYIGREKPYIKWEKE